MKDLNLLIWLSQLGLSVAVPPFLMISLAIWLRDTCGWGAWVVWAGIVIGILMAIDGLWVSLQTMQRLSQDKKKDSPPPVSFNDHD